MPYGNVRLVAPQGGFFSSIWGTMKHLVQPALAAVPGVGPVASAVYGAGRAALAHPIATAAATGAAGALATAGVSAMQSPSGMHMPGTAPGSLKLPSISMHGRAHRLVPRWNKHTKSYDMVPARRRMNPLNPRALRRAITRTHRFAKIAMHAIHIVHPKKKGSFGGFKKRRRSSAAARR